MKIERILVTGLCLVIPTHLLANAGSPMMWFGMFHSLVLNALIGLVESSILQKYKIENSTWLIIVANYLSMIIGLYFIAPYFSTISGNNDFWAGRTSLGYYELPGFMMGMVTAFFATLIIEYPLFRLAVKDKEKRTELTNPYLIANLVTNLAMLLIYFMIVRTGGHW